MLKDENLLIMVVLLEFGGNVIIGVMLLIMIGDFLVSGNIFGMSVNLIGLL